MKGTALGSWLARDFSNRLMKLSIPMSRRNGQDIREYYGLSYHDPNFNPGKAVVPGTGKTVAQLETEGKSFGLERYQAFYSASSNVPTERHTVPSIDGACGWSSVERIANAIGVTLEWHKPVGKQSKNRDIWTAHVAEDWQPGRGGEGMMGIDWITEYRTVGSCIPYEIVRAHLPLSCREEQALWFILMGFEPYPREDDLQEVS
jgi:hypothetical protein